MPLLDGNHIPSQSENGRRKLRSKSEANAARIRTLRLNLDFVGPLDVFKRKLVGPRGPPRLVLHRGSGKTAKVLALSNDDRLKLVNRSPQLRDLPCVSVRQLPHASGNRGRVGSLEVRLGSDDIGGQLLRAPSIRGRRG